MSARRSFGWYRPRGRFRLGILALAALAAPCVWDLLTLTTRERVERLLKAAVNAVEARERDALRPLLAADFRSDSPWLHARDREQALDQFELLVKSVHSLDVKLGSFRCQNLDPGATVDGEAVLLARLGVEGMTVPMGTQLHFEAEVGPTDDASEWVFARLLVLELGELR